MTELTNLPPDQSDSFESLPNLREIRETEEQAEPEELLEMTDLMSSLLNEASPVLIITAAYDHTIRFWDVLQGTCLATLQHNESQVNCLAISSDKKFLAVGGNPNVRIFDIDETLALALSSSQATPQQNQSIDLSASTANIQAKNILQGHTDNITSVLFQSSNQWILTASTDGTLKIWDWPGLKCQREFVGKAAINKAVLHPNQAEIILGYEAGYLSVLDLLKGTFTIDLCPEENVPITCVAISDDGERLAMVNEFGNLYVWLSKSSQTASIGFIPFGTVKAVHKPYAIKCSFSPNSQMLVTMGTDGLIKNWSLDLHSKGINLLSTLVGHSNWIWDSAFSADSSFLLTGASDNTARLWDMSAGEMICIYTGHSKAITAVAMNDSILN